MRLCRINITHTYLRANSPPNHQ